MSSTIRLSADTRTALRQAITSHPRWDEHRRTTNLSLATMTRDDYLATADALGIDLGALTSSEPLTDRERENAAAPTVTRAVAPTSEERTLHSAAMATRGPREIERAERRIMEARTATEHDAVVAQAQADFAEPEADPVPTSTEIPDMPTPASPVQMAKIDSLIAIGVDPDLPTYTALAQGLQSAISAARALRAELDRAPAADPRTAALAALVKPSLDFVPPSWSRDFADMLAIGATIAVAGPAGNGKTTGARKLLERSGFNVYEFDCTDATLPQDLIGRTTLRQDNGATVTEWSAGPIAKAFADPKGAVLLNEYDALDPRTGMALQSALESADVRRVTAPDSGEQLRSHGPCPIVLTLNTIGHGATVEYQGRNALDGANRDRIEIITTGYEAEADIMVAHGYQRETADRLAAWAHDSRAKLAGISSREILSNRRLLTAAALIDRCGYSLGDAVRKAFVCRLPEREQATFA